ncbi:MAG: J domain-containing protein [Acidimicrobiales bacterium]
MDINPYQALGVPSTAGKAEITAAYRIMAQLFHPDRYAEAPEPVRREAERRMKELNEAYKWARNATPIEMRRVNDAANRQRTARKKSPDRPPNFGVPFEQAQRERAEQSVKAHAARLARERAAKNGRAVGRPKPVRQNPSTLAGLGEALHTNNIPCRRCRSIQWLPPGWSTRLDELDFYCGDCDRLLLSRSFA